MRWIRGGGVGRERGGMETRIFRGAMGAKPPKTSELY